MLSLGSRLEARQSQAPCVPKTATIAATYTNGNGAVQNGWVRSFTNSLGEYGFTPLASSALQISYCALPSGNAAFDILMTVCDHPCFTDC